MRGTPRIRTIPSGPVTRPTARRTWKHVGEKTEIRNALQHFPNQLRLSGTSCNAYVDSGGHLYAHTHELCQEIRIGRVSKSVPVLRRSDVVRCSLCPCVHEIPAFSCFVVDFAKDSVKGPSGTVQRGGPSEDVRVQQQSPSPRFPLPQAQCTTIRETKTATENGQEMRHFVLKNIISESNNKN